MCYIESENRSFIISIRPREILTIKDRYKKLTAYSKLTGDPYLKIEFVVSILHITLSQTAQNNDLSIQINSCFI